MFFFFHLGLNMVFVFFFICHFASANQIKAKETKTSQFCSGKTLTITNMSFSLSMALRFARPRDTYDVRTTLWKRSTGHKQIYIQSIFMWIFHHSCLGSSIRNKKHTLTPQPVSEWRRRPLTRCSWWCSWPARAASLYTHWSH